jgi:hypothetical protein
VKQPPRVAIGQYPGSFYGTAALADNQEMQLAVRTGGDSDKPTRPPEKAGLKDSFPSEGTSSSSRVPPVQATDPADADPPVPDDPGPLQGPKNLPLALRRIHERLNKPTEFLKLHLLHYHMSPSSFRRRTLALALPEHVYEKYTQVCQECSACNEAQPPPVHSKVSGLRATNFGDLIFIDHCNVRIKEKDYIVLIVLDGATHFLWAEGVPSKGEEDAMAAMRTFMDL